MIKILKHIVTKHNFSTNVDQTKRKVVVFGGTGYVGLNVIKYALTKYENLEITSISRSGKPLVSFDSMDKVSWQQGDVMKNKEWQEQLLGVDAVISCVGAFGSNSFMEEINGDANINLISQSLKAKSKRFVYISTVDNNLPSFMLRGYFNGKRRTEEALMDSFGTSGVILKPGFMYGTRNIPLPKLFQKNLSPTLNLPLGIIGRPLNMIFSSSPIKCIRNSIPGMLAMLEVPINVEDVAKVAIAMALENSIDKSILNVEDILSIAKKFN